MTVKTNSFQQEFFAKLQGKFSDDRAAMIRAIGDQLHVGRDAVYRRLRGETPLTGEEMIALARLYNICLDPVNTSDIPKMHYPDGAVEITSEAEYFRDVLMRSEMMAALDDVRVDYATPELPLFYELNTPVLLAYKTYVYGLTTWNFSKWKDVPFRPELIDPEVQQIANRLQRVLYSFPARELWSAGILDITLREIEHGVQVGYLIDDAMVGEMFRELEETIKHMESMTRIGKRFPPGERPAADSPDFRVYHNEMTNTNNVILIRSPQQSVVYTTFVNPNYLFSSDARVINQMQTWFDNLVASSNVLSADTGKYAVTYFKGLRKKVADTKNRIQVMNSII